MTNFKNQVAVITGAANGIGFGIAERCAQEGLKIVLSDIETEALAKAEHKLRAAGADVISVQTDVSKAQEVEKLAQKTIDAFGKVNFIFNNAGVSGGTGNSWERTQSDWEWTLGVNLWGVIHGIRTFVPIMLEQDTECYVINTASTAALISMPGEVIYSASKHAIISMSETLHLELEQIESKIKVAVICPFLVNTKIITSERNRPKTQQNQTKQAPKAQEDAPVDDAWAKALEQGQSPAELANCVFQAIREDKFYIIPDPAMKPMAESRMQDIMQERNPSNVFAP